MRPKLHMSVLIPQKQKSSVWSSVKQTEPATQRRSGTRFEAFTAQTYEVKFVPSSILARGQNV